MDTDQAAYILRATKIHEEPVEIFSALLLDEDGSFVRAVKVDRGDYDHVLVDPKKILERAQYWETPFVILAHHHPGEAYPIPSEADVEVTKTFRKYLRRNGVKLLDHIVLGDKAHVSINELFPGLWGRLKAIFV